MDYAKLKGEVTRQRYRTAHLNHWALQLVIDVVSFTHNVRRFIRKNLLSAADETIKAYLFRLWEVSCGRKKTSSKRCGNGNRKMISKGLEKPTATATAKAIRFASFIGSLVSCIIFRGLSRHDWISLVATFNPYLSSSHCFSLLHGPLFVQGGAFLLWIICFGVPDFYFYQGVNWSLFINKKCL